MSEVRRRELARHSRSAIVSAGESQVWIKWPSHAEFPSEKADEPIEAVAAAETYPAVISALQRQAAKDGLHDQIEQSRGPSGRRAVDIRLESGRETVCLWRVREVPRLLHATIVIDDMGQDLAAEHRLLALPYPVTFSVLPHLRYSTEIAVEAAHTGREVMLHLPMEADPGSHPAPGDGEIRVGMGAEAVRQIIEGDLRSVPHVAGVNNHMGSRATASAPLMGEVMRALAERNLYFVDSRTTTESVALDAARRQGLPTFYRSVFLDDTETVSYTLGQLKEFRRLVVEHGAALAIGHPHPTTLEALARFLPQLERDDIQLVPASQLVRLPEVARLSPPRRPGS
ncbi:MAG: divergent polysaccharide deacetylase family protein [Acidobacteriia bacterium]|nr:divergent polysaccharide deacetylase family protein [Terriglobia bacterium]